MSTTQIRIASAGLFFLLIFLSGFWLSRAGKPYPVIVFTLHKLIALGAVVFVALTARSIHQVVPLGPGQWTAIAVAGLCFVATIVTGGLMSIEKPMPVAVSTLHHLIPYGTVLSTAAALYLLFAVSRQVSTV